MASNSIPIALHEINLPAGAAQRVRSAVRRQPDRRKTYTIGFLKDHPS
jgi:hypothetical protein